MATPVKNVPCAGLSNIYGGFDHTLFLGCSIMSFSASAGWNEQQSELTVQLVRDLCASPSGYSKKYYDANLAAANWTAADPGFYGLVANIIGAPVYFRIGDFEFSGQVQSWEESYGESGLTYNVKIVDPRQIVENAQVIINEYAGSVGGIYNLINAFGYMETTGINCPQYYQSSPGVYSAGSGSNDGAVFGSPAVKYGGADVNANGMKWNQILSASRILLSSFPATTNVWSPYGRLAFRAPASGTVPAAGMGLMPADTGTLAYYYLDLEEVPTAPSYWRVNGANAGMMDLITQICQDSGHDYYIELVPVVGGVLGAGIHKFIKIRTADRNLAPALSNIDSFANAAGRHVISYSKGRELRNEITSSFVIGGPKNSVYQAEQSDDPEGDGQPTTPEADDMIIPYFGLDPATGDVIIPEQDVNGWWFFTANSNDLVLTLGNAKYNRTVSSTIVVNEKELVAAQSGFDQWMSYASYENTALWQELNVTMKGLFNFEHFIKGIRALGTDTDKLKASDLEAARASAFKPHTDTDYDLEVIKLGYSWIKKLVDEYYGKQYQVRVPFTCGRTDTESGRIFISEQPIDSGWTEVTPVIGLAHPTIFTDFFTGDDNKLGAFCRFDNSNGLQTGNLNVNDYVSTTNKMWIKTGVLPEYVFIDKSTLFSPRAVITLPQPISAISTTSSNDSDLNKAFSGLIELARKDGADDAVLRERFDDIQKRMGAIQTHVAWKSKAEVPSAAAFGIQSNVLTYGPWASSGAVGAVQVTHDEGLVPWEYNGFTTLNLAGNSIANAGVTNQQVAEQGSVTIVGYPEVPLGAELRSADTGGPFSGGGNNLVENRVVGSGTVNSINYYFQAIGKWTGSYGPNVTGMQVNVGEQGMTTSYQIRTWTPKFGKFARGNAERIKQIGKLKLDFNKKLRAFTKQRLREEALKTAQSNRDSTGGDGAWTAPRTPHEVLVGEYLPWNSGQYRRPVIGTMSMADAAVELAEITGSGNTNTDKFFASFDTLFLPITNKSYYKYGSDGIRQLFGVAHPKNSVATPPFIYNNQDTIYQNSYENSDRAHRSLHDPFRPLLPGSYSPGDAHDPTSTNHMEILGTEADMPPGSSLVRPIEGYARTTGTIAMGYDSTQQEDSIFKTFALRGPLYMKGWGLDTDGFPIPNAVDNEEAAESGFFQHTGLSGTFLTDFHRKPQTWPDGPIDLRWDRRNAVWTIPQKNRWIAAIHLGENPTWSTVGAGDTFARGLARLYDTTEINDGTSFINDNSGNYLSHNGSGVNASGAQVTYKFLSGDEGEMYLQSGVYGSGECLLQSGDRILLHYDSQLGYVFVRREETQARPLVNIWREDALVADSGSGLLGTSGFRNLIIGNGLSLYREPSAFGSPCATTKLGLNLLIDGEQATSITTSGCISSSTDGSGNINLSCPTTSSGVPPTGITYDQFVVSSIGVTCCPSGGVDTVDYYLDTLHFVSGVLRSVTVGVSPISPGNCC